MKKFYAFLAAATVMTAASAQTIYLRGSANELNWDSDYTATAVDGKITFELTNVTEFKISTTGGADWPAFDAGALTATITNADLGKAVALTAGTNNIKVPYTGDYKFEIPADFSTITATTATPAPAAYTTLYLRGAEPLSWDNNKEITAENGVFKFTLEGASNFKMSVTGGATWDEFDPGCYFANFDSANLGTKVTLTMGTNNILLPWVGDYTFEVAADMSYVIATTTTPEPVGEFKKIYIRGGMNGWGTPDEWQMSTDDGKVYWFDCIDATAIPVGTEFKIADAAWGSINYTAGDEVIPQPDVEEELALEWIYNSNANSVMGVDYTGTIKAYLPEVLASAEHPMLVAFYPEIIEHKNTSGIANVTVEGAAPVYYNLQGVRVANPENGLFIERCGDKVRKVLIK